MKVVVQRSIKARCIVNDKVVGQSDRGLVLLVGFTDGDNEDIIDYMVKKIINLRIFDDENNIMNKSILEIDNTSILSISQFTLYADTSKGNRPSYIKAMNGAEASKLYDLFNQKLANYIPVQTGIFGEDMKIEFTNDGPITIILER